MKQQSTRQFKLGNALIAALVGGIGIVTLLGLVAEEDTVSADLASLLLQLAAVSFAIAVLVGIFNLLGVHLGRIIGGKSGWLYSIFTILAGLVVLGVYLADKLELWEGELKGEQISPQVFHSLQVSVEAALAGIVAFFLVYAAYRLLNKRLSWSNILFIVIVGIVLLGGLALDTDTFRDVREWLMTVPVLAGSRGLLIGIGLGTVIVGIRVLVGYDQAYREP